MDEKEINNILKAWDLAAVQMRPEIAIAGSPERTEYRVVIEADHGRLYIVEQINSRLKERKLKIAQTLETLVANGFKTAQKYLRNCNGDFLSKYSGGLWQVVPYVKGVELNRPGYVHDRWRGKAMADLLLDLRRCSGGIPDGSLEPCFALPKYIDQLMRAIEKNRPDILDRARLMHQFARENLYSDFSSLPTAFCHGDYHPVNIIWKEGGIAALIDWEFMGRRPEPYDAANAVGCLGIEDPECLWGDTVKDFIKGLRSGGFAADTSFQYFLPLVISLRFAWLSEWLRRKDEEMIEMEFDYFDVLSTNRKDFARILGC